MILSYTDTNVTSNVDGIFPSTFTAFGEDVTLDALIRAWFLKFECKGLTEEEIIAKAMERTLITYYGSWLDPNTLDTLCSTINEGKSLLTIIRSQKQFDDSTPALETIRDNLVARDEWEQYNDAPFPLDKYLSVFAPTIVLSNSKQKRIVLITTIDVDSGYATKVWMHAVAGVLCKAAPWYYPDNPKNGKKREVKPEEQRVFKTLSCTPSKDCIASQVHEYFVAYVNDIAENSILRNIRIQRAVVAFSNRGRESALTQARDTRDSALNYIHRVTQDLNNMYDKYSAAVAAVAAIESSPTDNGERFLEFFKDRKNVVLRQDSTPQQLVFEVRDTLEYYDAEVLKNMYDNKNSYLYEGDLATIRLQLEYIVKRLLLEKRGIIATNAVFMMNTGFRVTPLSGASYAEKSMPNMHIYRYACSGQNDHYYAEYANAEDWDLGIEQAISATKNLNVGDSTVFKHTILHICSHSDGAKNAFIYVNDGHPMEKVEKTSKKVTFKEFIKIVDEAIKSEEEQAKAEEVKEGEVIDNGTAAQID